MKIEFADSHDLLFLASHDRHIEADSLLAAVEQERVLLIENTTGSIAGWLRFSFFWETIPFIDMLYVLAEYRNQSYGTALMNFFEQEMSAKGCRHLMTSTSSQETAQHLYYKLGYQASGGFFPPDEPYELILAKTL